MVYRRGGVLAGRLRRGSGLGVHLAGLHVRVPIRLCAQGFGALPVLPVAKPIGCHKVMWTAVISATAVHGVTRASASDAKLWQGAHRASCRDRRGRLKKSGGHIEA